MPVETSRPDTVRWFAPRIAESYRIRVSLNRDVAENLMTPLRWIRVPEGKRDDAISAPGLEMKPEHRKKK